MRGIPIEDPSTSHCRDDAEDADNEIFSVRFTKAFHFLEAEERANHQPIGDLAKISQRSLSAMRDHTNGTDHRDACLEEELDCRLERMTEIARTLRAACARQREQFLAFRVKARWCYRDCVRLFADMTRHYGVRLSAQRRQVTRTDAAMAVVANRNLELNKVFGELLARATCTIDDLEERNVHTRTELGRQRDENDVLERRVASLENANRSAQHSTSALLAKVQESEARVNEAEGKVESFDNVAKYYEQLLEASHRKLCLYEDYGDASRRTLSDKSQKVCDIGGTDNGGHGSVTPEGTRIKTHVGEFNRNVHTRASSYSVVCERAVRYRSCKIASTTNDRYATCSSIGASNEADITDGCIVLNTTMPIVEDTTSRTSPLDVGTRRRRGSNAFTAADIDSNSTPMLSEPPVRLPRKRTQKKRRLTRQLRKSCSFKEVDRPDEVASDSEQAGGVRRERRKSTTVPRPYPDDDQQPESSNGRTQSRRERSKSTAVPYLHPDDCQQSEPSNRRTQRDRLNDGEPIKIVTFLPRQPENITEDGTTPCDSQTDDSATLMSRDPTSQNKAKLTATFKGLKISGNVGFASFVRDVHRKLRRPRRSKTVELADLIGVRKADTDSLNSDCNL